MAIVSAICNSFKVEILTGHTILLHHQVMILNWLYIPVTQQL